MRDISAESKVQEFYETDGWHKSQDGHTSDAARWEDLRPVVNNYLIHCRKRIQQWLPPSGEAILDAASGPVQYPEYLDYSRNFKHRICVDLSQLALDQAKEKLGDHGQYICGSILDLPLKTNSVDAAISLHTIYHIDKSQQEAAVKQLLRVCKPGQPVVVIYANPERFTSRIRRIICRTRLEDEEFMEPLYYYAHPLRWWTRFFDVADVSFFPWRSLTAQDSRRIIPNGTMGRWLLKLIFKAEATFPNLCVKFGAYPAIVLRKRN